MDTLKEKTAKGLFWGAMNSGTMQVLNLVFGIFLARMLSPHGSRGRADHIYAHSRQPTEQRFHTGFDEHEATDCQRLQLGILV